MAEWATQDPKVPGLILAWIQQDALLITTHIDSRNVIITGKQGT